jgi:hypothetical protein
MELLITEGDKQKGQSHFKLCPFYGHTVDNLLPSVFPFAFQCQKPLLKLLILCLQLLEVILLFLNHLRQHCDDVHRCCRTHPAKAATVYGASASV